MISGAYDYFGCNSADVYILSISDSDNDAACILFDQTYGIEFPTISGIEGGGAAINNTYGIIAFPTYILIAPNHQIVEQDMWPISSTQTFINYFESHGLEQAPCGGFLTADFSSDITEVCETGAVNFTDESPATVTSWSWVFEGGEPATSTEQNPAVVYTNEGTYDVELTVSDGTNTNTLLLADYINVLMTPPCMLQPFTDVCLDDPPFQLTGGSPVGGIYSGDGVVDGWFYPATAGAGTHIIYYTYTAGNGCDNTAQQPIVVSPCTAIDEFADGMMSIYPNPTTGSFVLRVNYSCNLSVNIVNLLGERIYKQELRANGKLLETIDLSGYQDGIYFVTLRTDNRTFVKKLKLISN